jgi:hypothetical protein
MDPLCRPRNNFYQQKLALTSPTIGGRSVGIVRSRTKANKYVFFGHHDLTADSASCHVKRTQQADGSECIKSTDCLQYGLSPMFQDMRKACLRSVGSPLAAFERDAN